MESISSQFDKFFRDISIDELKSKWEKVSGYDEFNSPQIDTFIDSIIFYQDYNFFEFNLLKNPEFTPDFLF